MMRWSILALLALAACNHADDPPAITITDRRGKSSDVPPPLPVVRATNLDGLACAKLVALGCSDAQPKRGFCPDTFRVYRTNEIHAGDVDAVSRCITQAPDIAAVRRCGGPSMPSFECP